MTLTDSNTFLTATGYDVAAIMRDAHRRAKKMEALSRANGCRSYAEIFAFYLRQVWITAQHNFRARAAIHAAPTIVREGTLAYAHYARD